MHINFTNYQGNSICHVLVSLALFLQLHTGTYQIARFFPNGRRVYRELIQP